METNLLLKILLAFIVGGSWVALSSTIADKFGSKMGGLVSGFPAPAAIAFFFIGYTQSVDEVVAATTIFPIAYSFAGILLLVYVFLAQRGLVAALLCAILAWVCASLLLIILHPKSHVASLLVYLVLLLVNYLLIWRVVKSVESQKQSIKYTFPQTTLRAVLGGLVITTAVLGSYLARPQYGSIFAAFPAVFVSTLIIVHRTHGPNFSTAMVLPMFLSGMLTVVGYVTAIRYLYPAYGLPLGTLFAIIIASALTYITYRYVFKVLAGKK